MSNWLDTYDYVWFLRCRLLDPMDSLGRCTLVVVGRFWQDAIAVHLISNQRCLGGHISPRQAL